MNSRYWVGAAALSVAACVHTIQNTHRDIDATLARGGGITGLSETVHIWSTSGESRAIYARSDRQGSLPVQLPEQTLDSSLTVIESLIRKVPRIPPDTLARRVVCADVILLRIDVRSDARIDSAQEECPHRTRESELYWQRVDSLFELFRAAAR
jgi:hypothetical protein